MSLLVLVSKSCSRAGIVSCCRLVFGRARNAKSKSGQVAVSVFRQRIRSPLLRKARLWVALVSKQLRAQLVQLVQLSRRSNCRAVEQAHVRAGIAGFGSRKGGLLRLEIGPSMSNGRFSLFVGDVGDRAFEYICLFSSMKGGGGLQSSVVTPANIV